MSKNVLHIQSSASGPKSVTSKLSQAILEHLKTQTDLALVERDLQKSELPLLHPELIGAYFTPEDQRSPEQKKLLTTSDNYVQEWKNSDIIVMAAPMYNFGIPAALKAYFDLLARVNLTFSYTAEGPVGHLKNKKVIITVATGGTPLGSPYDFVTPYVKQFLNFLGVDDITFISIDQRGDFEQFFQNAKEEIQKIQV
jgi:FMN-dependent NADH-azoreductase